MALIVLAALLTPFPLCAQTPTGEKRPNIVVVLADDLGWGDLGCYGNKIIKTPNLDAFAKEGLRFTNGYAASAVCSPSRSAIMTGRTPFRNGVSNWIPANSEMHLRNSEITYVTLLRRAGYATCHVGKWHLNGMFNSPKQPQPNDHGYDWWLATQNNAAPSHKDPKNFVRNGEAVGDLQGFSSHLVVDEAIRWLTKERDSQKPFVLSVWFHEPHLPIETDTKFLDLYPEIREKDANLAQHHGNVSQLDAAFGRLMQTLQDLKLAENTIVIFTSDNGPEGNGTNGRTRGSTGGLRGRKRAVYEGGIRVPFMVRWPGHVPAGKTSDEPVIGSDIFSTACDITRVAPPADRVIDGVSLNPVFAGKTLERKTPMYFHCPIAPGQFKIAMRQGDYTLLADTELKKFELYNLRDDVSQSYDLSSRETERLATMTATLRKLNAEIEAEGPVWQKAKKKAK